ncbi:hypothetical protein M8818_004740 [Zalaria obscura]|uniref:Uncharacterized protein n=1 Tax=Zalaria obscura TaxID=2024903 RepID=A0ACC3SBZ7_9PEZI
MGQTVEANSLGSLTALASNPPLYPRNPTENPHDPLTLYIVRVPGSKDVFLTPLKPKEKVVNAQDVASSLYFLHVDAPEEDAMIETEDRESLERLQDSSSSNENGSMQVPRKPLPTPPVSPSFELEDSRTSSETMKRLSVPMRKPVLPARSPNRLSPSPERPPPYAELDLPELPPRPPKHTFSRDSSHQSESGAPSDFPLSPRAPPVPDQQLQDRGWGQIQGPRHNHGGEPQRRAVEHQVRNDELDAGASLTLIRRDPTSGAQWNVARIRDPPVHDVSSTFPGKSHQRKVSGAPLYLDLNNPGYTKFTQFEPSRPVSRGSLETSSSSSEAMAADGVFRRRLWMDGSRFGDHAYGRKMRASQDLSSVIRPALELAGRQWRSTPKTVDRRSKGYAFRSPWDGKCDFTTGKAGRALRCRHTLENGISNSPSTAEVSELRFNLPVSNHFSQPTSSPGVADTVSKRSSYFARPHHKRDPSDNSDDMQQDWTSYRDEDGNIDLSLGQERAGGGFGGKQAKLGKLIIEDEGQKMLDLVVAANMALWWRAYERT